ncbi:MAG: Alkyl hydroperoxide reductase subunit F [Candidatus Magasanikbacteria bacterium GW2011_GWC2_34_16]|uniref:Alkyl hydroperoxide reductase subunit F n=2 Tax=Candidatus Magasanikiibacteriota TaxID=1752731 RepID=A0A0G0KKK5_9BACT|nr:MAG: Alkyl hydroperoxide reductase subunit F [Candidatus Magasanikbacteria bacterium GW2011_GWC2_34_16]KKQ41106.1 MAG: Alkyl hydroperoxide reductase subunit F [Candidatus Magasanikbacteria bacterium GW2011_GWA2_37_8]
MLDLLIIGASAAGSSAAIYAARRKLNFKVVTDNIGGEVALSGVVNNWPGIIEIQGYELAQKFNEHVKSYNVAIDEGWRVEKIVSENNHHTVTTKNSTGEIRTYETKTVLIATGIHPRRLDVPGEKELYQKGVTYCTVCDGPLFKNKVTATIGSGNAALESAMMMATIATKVYLISKYTNTQENNSGFPKGENIMIDKVKELPNVEIIYGAKTIEIVGPERVKALKYLDETGTEKSIDVQGVMVHAGQIPNSQFIETVEKTRTGEIIVDQKCCTNIPGIFAAGDVTNIPYKQIGISAGQGIIASLAAIEYINRWKE